MRVRERYDVLPKLEALAAVKGEYLCTNDDIIRNTAYSWSPMSAQEITDKTGIESRVYSERPLEDLALQAARAALEHAGRRPEEIGAVLFCSCTSTRMMPSVATWLSGQLGMQQTHASCDIVAACAGLPYGLAEATRLLQEVDRPVLLVCGEKFSDKIGTVRPPRMIFGDGAAALVIAPAAPGEQTDIEVLQTYASGPVSEVNSIIWPNPEFDNNITVYGPEVRSLAGRYLKQMIDELQGQTDPDGKAATLLDSIDLIVPHQANKTMVIKLAAAAGVAAGPAVLQHRDRRQHLGRQHPDRHRRREGGRRHRQATSRLRAGLRRRRRRRIRGVAGRSGGHRPGNGDVRTGRCTGRTRRGARSHALGERAGGLRLIGTEQPSYAR